jgi:hypothetical protein
MPNHQFRLRSHLSGFDHVIDSGISEDEWRAMSEYEKADERNQTLWACVDVVDED